jgi:hypothetical protein
MSGHFDLVQTEGARLLHSVPDFPSIRLSVAVSFIHDRRQHDAIRVLRGLSEKTPTISGQICRFLRLGLEGQPGDSKSCFDPDLLKRARNVEYWSLWVSECYAFINETDLAIDWLETAFRKGYWNYPYVSKHSTVFRKFDGYPRFQDVLSRMKTAWEQFEP